MRRLGYTLAAIGAWSGCTGPALRTQSPEGDDAVVVDVDLIGDLARPHGMNYVQVEGFSLVTGLEGAGSSPGPSAERAAVLAEMQRREVEEPGKILSSPDTSLALVRGYLRPGIEKGDRIDVEVRVPARSETKSLRNGWLLETRMTELALLGQQLHTGHLLALAKGPVLVDPTADKDDGPLSTRGRVLGGGVALKSRPLGLIVAAGHQSVHTAQQIGTVLNRRFHLPGSASGQGLATPKTDKYIEIAVHPRYKDNIDRYMRVIRNVAFRETAGQQVQRLLLLERQLMDPVTSETAALRLEATGKVAADVLKKGLQSEDPEVRFYAAEALAYLDVSEAAEPLAAAARDEPAFRMRALVALGAMDDILAHDELIGLLSESSAETRYGAFRALWMMNPSDVAIRGETLNGQFSYHVVAVDGPPMIHVTRSKRPEIALFGTDHPITGSVVLEAGRHIMISSTSNKQLSVSRFAVGEPDQQRIVPPTVDALIHAIVELEGTYPDVVQALAEAKEAGAIESRLKVDALPEGGRQPITDEDENDAPVVTTPPPSRDTQEEEAGMGSRLWRQLTWGMGKGGN